MMKIRLKLLDFNTSGSFSRALKPNRDSDGENVIISDIITPHGFRPQSIHPHFVTNLGMFSPFSTTQKVYQKVRILSTYLVPCLLR
jgi:hypothetical protein